MGWRKPLMTAFSNYAENLVLSWLFTSGSTSRPTSWFVALHSQNPTEIGNVGELSSNGYARQACSFTLAGNQVSNSGVITFGPNTSVNWGSVSHLSIWDADGNCLAYGPLDAAISINVGDSLTIAAGSLDISLE